MRRKPGNLRHRFKTPNGASRRSAQAPAAAQYTPPQRQQPHYYTARPQHNAVVSGTRPHHLQVAAKCVRGNARLRNESPPKRRGHNTMRSYPVHAPASSASRRKMRPAATHACETNRRRTRTHYKVKGDAFRHLLFHNPRLRTRSQSPATAIRPSAGKA